MVEHKRSNFSTDVLGKKPNHFYTLLWMPDYYGFTTFDTFSPKIKLLWFEVSNSVDEGVSNKTNHFQLENEVAMLDINQARRRCQKWHPTKL